MSTNKLKQRKQNKWNWNVLLNQINSALSVLNGEKQKKLKSKKKKNIETFRILWGISYRVQILSENFFLSRATMSILNNKMYRTFESKEAVYTCLPNFVEGSRNYTTFYRILN